MVERYLHGVETIEVTDGIRPVKVNKSAVIGVVGTAPDASNSDWPLDEPVLLTSQPRKAATLGVSGTLGPAIQQIYAEGGATVVAVRVDTAATIEAQLTKVIGDLNAKTGVHALLGARGHLGVPPRTLIAPGFTSQRPTSAPNPVVAALLPVANRLRGRIYADTPSTYAEALAWREDWSSRRVVPFYPAARIWDRTASAYVTRPQSASQAGLTSRVHDKLGFWFSSSNQELYGVGGTSVPVDWASADADCEANLLNENRVNTIINMGGEYGGWRRWGSATCASDPAWKFEPVGNSLDIIYEALEEAYYWMVDKPFSTQLLIDGAERANRFFRYMKTQGALVGGRCWLDPERNTAEQFMLGVVSWDIDPEAPAPMEHIRFYARRNGDYYEEAVREATSQLSSS